jgi:hypothetical protein
MTANEFATTPDVIMDTVEVVIVEIINISISPPFNIIDHLTNLSSDQAQFLLVDPDKICSNGNCRFDLLKPVVNIHMVDRILRGMVIGVLFTLVIVFDLKDGCDALLTEGSLISSRTSFDKNWR